MIVDEPNVVKQCRSCPWRVDCVPERDIPNYVPDLHEKLDASIQSGLQTMFCAVRHVMACHYSKPGEEFPCAGWLHHQIGPGNNIGVRIGVMTGHYPVPEVEGDQHETFEDTLSKSWRRMKRSSKQSLRQRKGKR